MCEANYLINGLIHLDAKGLKHSIAWPIVCILGSKKSLFKIHPFLVFRLVTFKWDCASNCTMLSSLVLRCLLQLA